MAIYSCPECAKRSRAPIAEGGGELAWAAKILAAHNLWRRDDEGDTEQGNPNDIGRAIDIAIESLSRQGGESRCPHCDDTGDVHTPDGEWHGICSCPAGDSIGKDTPDTTRASEAGDSDLLNVIDLIRTGKDGRKYDYAISRADTMVHVAPLFADIAAAPAPGGGPVNSNNQTRISDEN